MMNLRHGPLLSTGGFNHVGEMTFMMFQAMELELRKHLSASSETTNLAVKDKITKTISANEDVLFSGQLCQ